VEAYSGTAGRLGLCLSGVMMKSLAIAAAAALSGPAIGVVVFFAANGEHSKGEATSLTLERPLAGPKTGQAGILRTFAPQGLWRDPTSILALDCKPQTSTVGTLAEPLAWPTVVTCPEGQPLLKNGRCSARKNVPALSTDTDVTADATPRADASGGIEIPERPPFSSGRMSLVAP
jgi:hypothetical protein